MANEIENLAQPCPEVRGKLENFLNDGLAEAEAEVVREHLLNCQPCSEVLGELILESLSQDELMARPLPIPLPPQSLYEDYLRARNGYLGALWKTVRDAFRSLDQTQREWASAQIARIGAGIEKIFFPPFPLRALGAGPVRPPDTEASRRVLPAQLLSTIWEPTGKTLPCLVEEGPRITEAGEFRLRLKTEAAQCEGREVICTVKLSGNLAVSFSGTFRSVAEGATCEAEILEDGLPCPTGSIPLEHVELSVAAGQ